MVAKKAHKIKSQDKLGTVTVKNAFCDKTDNGKVFVCIKVKDLLSLSFRSSDI